MFGRFCETDTVEDRDGLRRLSKITEEKRSMKSMMFQIGEP